MTKKPRLGNNPILPFIQDSEKQAEAQANTQASPQADTHAKPQAKKQANTQAGRHAKKQAQAQVTANPQAVKDRITQGIKRERLEDIRTRRTYWLLDEDIDKIDQLAREAGTAKHNIIGAAVSLFYDYAYKGGR
jgi:hypothetical protein